MILACAIWALATFPTPENVWPVVPGWKVRTVTAIPPEPAPTLVRPPFIKEPTTSPKVGWSVSCLLIGITPTIGSSTDLKNFGSPKGGKGGLVVSGDRGKLHLYTSGEVPLKGTVYGHPIALDVVRLGDRLSFYVDGKLSGDLNVSGIRSFDLGDRLHAIRVAATATYNRALTPAEIAKNATAGIRFIQDQLPDTKTVTLDLKLTALTEVPDPARMKPYRSALVAQEYTVTGIVAGHQKGLKPGAKVRIFRYGVFDGKKTDVQNQKKGDSARITVELLSADPVMSREYQLDDLDTDASTTYYVELPGSAKKPSP
jgi:hypothetical protein